MGISGVSNQPDSHSVLLWLRLCITSTLPPPLLSLIKQKCCEQGHQMFKVDVCEDFPKLMFYNMMDITWPSWKEVIHESLSFHIFIVITDFSSSFGNVRYFFLFHNKDIQYPFDVEKEETGIQRDWKKERGGDWCLCHSGSLCLLKLVSQWQNTKWGKLCGRDQALPARDNPSSYTDCLLGIIWSFHSRFYHSL